VFGARRSIFFSTFLASHTCAAAHELAAKDENVIHWQMQHVLQHKRVTQPGCHEKHTPAQTHAALVLIKPYLNILQSIFYRFPKYKAAIIFCCNRSSKKDKY